MPSSSTYHISMMLQHVQAVRPLSIVDIGVGFGKWGFLCRESLDILEERYSPNDWRVRIDGVEAFPDYATPLYDYIYNNIYYGDVMDVIDKLGSYDLAILGDVIEHFEKEVGVKLLAKLATKCKFLLISSPTKFYEQSAFDNPYEEHKSLWGLNDFKQHEFFDYDEVFDATFVALLDCQRTGKIRRSQGISSRIAYSLPALRSHPKIAYFVKSAVRRLVPA